MVSLYTVYVRCMYVSLEQNVHWEMSVNTHTHTHTYIYIYIYTYMCVCVCVFTDISQCTFCSSDTYIYIYIYMCVCVWEGGDLWWILLFSPGSILHLRSIHTFLYLLYIWHYTVIWTGTIVKETLEQEHSMPVLYLDAWLAVHSDLSPTAPIVQKAGL